jgi:hypothetical protein
MDFAELSALVDRWRLENHSLHLPCGNATVTLQDFAMLLGLPIDGYLVCGRVDPTGWRVRVGELIDICPPDVRPNDKDKKLSDVHSGWLTANFNTCPEGENDDVVQRYARAWLWHMVASFLFSNGSGSTISQLVLPVLRLEWDIIAMYNWGYVGVMYPGYRGPSVTVQ